MQDNTDNTDSAKDERARLLVSTPVILRALASYLEVTGEAEKFADHLASVMEASGLEVEIFDGGGRGPSFDGGGRGPSIG